MVTLEINHVDCQYGSVKILSDVTLEVKPGDFMGILGPNGSGKTTLLKSISRVLKPHGGSILIDKTDIYSLKPLEVAKKMAVVPQDSTVGFNFSVVDVVLMGRNPHLGRFQMETSKDLEIAKEAMELTNTWSLADRPINELSGGERQRVIIARALAQEPKILLLDEPMSHLDIINQLEVMDLIKSLCIKNGMIVLAVIHDLNMAARYCDTALLLKGGKVFGAGSIEKVLTTENIKNVFQVDVIIRKHLTTNSLYVIPLSPKKTPTVKKGNVHIICGAGTGALIIKTFVDEGYVVTAGVLNVFDSDFDACESLKVLAISEAPFSSITDKVHASNLEMISRANMVVLTSVPFGLGNIKNLEAAIEATQRGIPTYVIDEVPIENRDFTGGKATALMAELKKKGAIFVNHPNFLLNLSSEKVALSRKSQTLTGHSREKVKAGLLEAS